MLRALKQQFEWIHSTRENMFAFLEEIPLAKLHEAIPNFGHGTIIGTHIHVADSYRFWLGSFAFNQKPVDFRETTNDEVQLADVQNVRSRFAQVDEIVERFLNEYSDRWFDEISHEVSWQDEPLADTPLHLITHVETHEFHHKGQIVSMARHLGYRPPADDRLGGLSK